MKKLDVHFIFCTVTNSSAFKQNSFIYEKKLFHFLNISMPFTNMKNFKFFFNTFHATDLFWYPLKTSQNLWFSDVFRRYQKKSVAWNGLKPTCNTFDKYYTPLTITSLWPS